MRWHKPNAEASANAAYGSAGLGRHLRVKGLIEGECMFRVVTLTVVLADLIFSGPCFAGQDKVIECDGTWEWQGLGVPKDAIAGRKQVAHMQYIVSDDHIVLSGENGIRDERLDLCGATAGQYRYSRNCEIMSPSIFAFDWLHETDIDAKTSPFYKKYLPKPDSVFGGKFIELNRSTLEIVDEDYDLHTTLEFKNMNGKSRLVARNYVVINRFLANCRLSKPKV